MKMKNPWDPTYPPYWWYTCAVHNNMLISCPRNYKHTILQSEKCFLYVVVSLNASNDGSSVGRLLKAVCEKEIKNLNMRQ